MKFKHIDQLDKFKKDLKKLLKRFPSLEEDLDSLVTAQLMAYHKLNAEFQFKFCYALPRNRDIEIMKTKAYKRFAIFGLPGSGKSTFADKLGKELNLPVQHLDRHYFLANWKIRDRNEFLAAQQKMVDDEAWIIEGNSIGSLEMRFARADVVLYFNLPRYLCLWRVFKRPFFHDKSINDMPEGCSKSDISWSLLKYLWSFNKEKKAKIKELRQTYPHVDFHMFTSSYDVEQFYGKDRKY